MNKYILIFYLSFIFLAGCTASMVVNPGKTNRSEYAPVNESSRRGVVKYLNQGAQSVIAQRRENAYKQMCQACGGKYRIIAEGPKLEGGSVVPVGNMMMYTPQQYIYIEFECIRCTTESK